VQEAKQGWIRSAHRGDEIGISLHAVLADVEALGFSDSLTRIPPETAESTDQRIQEVTTAKMP